jgi:DNA-binding response OmpR family regulator
MRKQRVLVAEDDRTARVSLVGLLEAEGFEVLSAGTGSQADSLLMAEELDVALLDIKMPGLDGLTVLRRAREGGLATPLIVMTRMGIAIPPSRR